MIRLTFQKYYDCLVKKDYREAKMEAGKLGRLRESARNEGDPGSIPG